MVLSDKAKIAAVIAELDEKKNEVLRQAHAQVNTVGLLGPNELNISFSGTAGITFNPHASKHFYFIPTNKCEKLSTHRELSVHSGRHLLVHMVGWLVELWCTRSRDLAQLIKSQKFSCNIVFIRKSKK